MTQPLQHQLQQMQQAHQHAKPAPAHAGAPQHVTCVASHPHLRLGRHRRDPAAKRLFPHMRDILARSGFTIPAEPVTFDYTTGFPASSGALHNDTRGDCTAAAKAHRLQQVRELLGEPAVPVDQLAALALQFYSESTGFDASKDTPDPQNPGQVTNPTDQGGDMQVIAKFLIDTGFPLQDGTRDKFVAAFELDPTDVSALAYCGNRCFGIDFGIIVTDTVMPSDGSPPPAIWGVKDGERQLGGHDIYSMARLANGNWKFDSWGLPLFQFTPAFLAKNVEEAFAYISADALKDGKTVLGLDLTSWQAAMAGQGFPINA